MSSEEGGSAAAAPSENLGLLRSLLFGGQFTPAIAVFNPTTGTLSIIHHGSPTTALFQPPKPGPVPATKDSIAALPSRDPTEEEILAGRDCAICLDEFQTVDQLITDMPCNHCFHRGCVQRWLRVNGSCPICRYAMPLDDHAAGEDKSSTSDDQDIDHSDDQQPPDTTSPPPVTLLFTLVIDRPTGSEPESAPRVVEVPDASEGSSGDVAS